MAGTTSVKAAPVTRTKADKVVLVAAFALAVAAAGAVAWLHFAWQSGTHPPAVTNSTVGLPENKPALTQAQRDNQAMYIAGTNSHSVQQWLAFQLMYRDGGLAQEQAHSVATARAAAVSVVDGGAGHDLDKASKTTIKIKGLDDTRIDGSSVDAMVNSINKITAALPDHYARVFQLALRILLVHSLPLNKMASEHINPATASETTLLSNAQQELSGMTALDVMKAAATLRAKLRQEQKDHTGPFASRSDKAGAAEVQDQENQ